MHIVITARYHGEFTLFYYASRIQLDKTRLARWSIVFALFISFFCRSTPRFSHDWLNYENLHLTLSGCCCWKVAVLQGTSNDTLCPRRIILQITSYCCINNTPLLYKLFSIFFIPTSNPVSSKQCYKLFFHRYLYFFLFYSMHDKYMKH